MIRLNSPFFLISAGLVLAVLLVYGVLFLIHRIPASADSLRDRIPVAVLGDSDSHGYHDVFDNLRGGRFNDISFNWAEVWELLHGNEIELGEQGAWGSSYRFARIWHALGLRTQAPRKFDFQYNYAVSGMTCQSLLNTWPYQARWLLDRIRRDRTYWDNGLVVIRIGINDLGQAYHLENWAESGLDDTARLVVDTCVDYILETTGRLLDSHPGITVVISGIVRDYNVPTTLVFTDVEEIARIEEVLQYYDNRLLEFTTAESRAVFFDDREWVTELFGDRARGELIESFSLADRINISNTVGDHPSNISLADLHGGTVYHGLWLRNMLRQLNEQTSYEFTLPTAEDIAGLICNHEEVDCRAVNQPES